MKAGSTATTTDWSQVFAHPAVIILPLLAGILTFAQSRMMMPPLRPDMTDQERTMGNVTKQMSVIFPMIIFVLSLNFPQGLALYWVTGTLFMVLQQYHLVGWGSLKVPAWFPGANRVTALSYPKHVPPTTAAATKAAIVPDGNGRRPARRRSGPAASSGKAPDQPAATPVVDRRGERAAGADSQETNQQAPSLAAPAASRRGEPM